MAWWAQAPAQAPAPAPAWWAQAPAPAPAPAGNITALPPQPPANQIPTYNIYIPEGTNIDYTIPEDRRTVPTAILLDDVGPGTILVNTGLNRNREHQIYFTPGEITGLRTPRKHPTTRRNLRTGNYRYYRIGRILPHPNDVARHPPPAAIAPGVHCGSLVRLQETNIRGRYRKEIISQITYTNPISSFSEFRDGLIAALTRRGIPEANHKQYFVILNDGFNMAIVSECPYPPDRGIRQFNALRMNGNTINFFRGVNLPETFTIAETREWDTTRSNHRFIIHNGPISLDVINTVCDAQRAAGGGRFIKRKSKTKRRVKSFSKRK